MAEAAPATPSVQLRNIHARLSGALDFDLLDPPGRQLLKQGRLRQPGTFQKKNRWALLFDDVLLLTNSRSGDGRSGPLEPKQTLWLRELALLEQKAGGGKQAPLSFYLAEVGSGAGGSQAAKAFEVFCNDPEEREAWVEAIAACLPEGRVLRLHAAEVGSSKRASELLGDLLLAQGKGSSPRQDLGLASADQQAQAAPAEAQPDSQGAAPPAGAIHEAVAVGDSARVEQLLARWPALVNQAHPEDGWSPLQMSCRSGNPEMVRLMLLRAPPGGNAAPGEAEAAQHLQLDFRHEASGETALHAACRSGNPGCVGALLEARADPNVLSKTGVSPLRIVATETDQERVPEVGGLLIAAAADVNELSEQGLNLLMEAAKLDRLPAVELFAKHLDLCAAVRAPRAGSPQRLAAAGQQAVHMAAQAGALRCLRWLLTAPPSMGPAPSPSARDARQRTPLHLTSDLRAAEELLRRGARPQALDARKQTAIHLLMGGGDDASIKELVRQWQAAWTALPDVRCPPGTPVLDPGNPGWIDDGLSQVCLQCGDGFTISRRKHHCRHCGQLVCGSCSPKYYHVEGRKKALRCCVACFNSLCALRKVWIEEARQLKQLQQPHQQQQQQRQSQASSAGSGAAVPVLSLGAPRQQQQPTPVSPRQSESPGARPAVAAGDKALFDNNRMMAQQNLEAAQRVEQKSGELEDDACHFSSLAKKLQQNL